MQTNIMVHIFEQEKCAAGDTTNIPESLRMIGTRLVDFEEEKCLIPDCLKVNEQTVHCTISDST